MDADIRADHGGIAGHTVRIGTVVYNSSVQEAAVASFAAPSDKREDQGPGRPIGEWDPHDLEVHPADAALGGPQPGVVPQRVLPGYVPRDHDQALAHAVADAAEGRSRMLVLVGTSSTGKTRACWEAVQPLAGAGWRLWHPFDPTRARAALEELQRVRPRTVVWLNEAQHYLGDTTVGEQIAAAAHALLTDPGRAPVLVLGTLWPQYADQYTALPTPGSPDPHSRVRELLAGRTLTIPDTFTPEALRAAAALAADGDQLLADALTRARDHGRLAQDLAGAPELLRRYHHSTPAARAVLEAAMDARRLGIGLHLPQAFLIDAAVDYLSDHDLAELPEDWAEQTFADLAHLVHGRQACLRRAAVRPRRRPPGSPSPGAVPASGAGPVFRLADYLEQHGHTTRRHLCPPASFWHAAADHLANAADLVALARAAEDRHRYRHTAELYCAAASAGDAAALTSLARMRERAGEREEAEQLYSAAADDEDVDALARLVELRAAAGDLQQAERLYQAAIDTENPFALTQLAFWQERVGNRHEAELLYRIAADAGDPSALFSLVLLLERAGEQEAAEQLARQAADTGDTDPLTALADLRQATGNQEETERLRQAAADAGDTDALWHLAESRASAGDIQEAERLHRAAVEAGDPTALVHLAELRRKAGEREEAERLLQQAADTKDPGVLPYIADLREKDGEREEAERLYRIAIDAGEISAPKLLRDIAEMYGEVTEEHLLRYGLEADGTPAHPWPWPEPHTTEL
ncbi:tetratricopeptide repeat protein [Streptomyces barkulensis]|uniref:tetratricopeptide repeat protein n=1 Tax=Streptomyces barkulensis TaxID=1257026 RepID=UPI000C6EEC4D|nr:tetratricopeptide repeat protein [Streptomyces barkulensis]